MGGTTPRRHSISPWQPQLWREAASILGALVGTSLAPISPNLRREQRRLVNENDHPKGALLFMLVYLALLAFMWTNLYLKLWTR